MGLHAHTRILASIGSHALSRGHQETNDNDDKELGHFSGQQGSSLSKDVRGRSIKVEGRKVGGIRNDGRRRGVDDTRRLQRTIPGLHRDMIGRPLGGTHIKYLHIAPANEERGGRLSVLPPPGIRVAVRIVGVMDALSGDPSRVVRMRQAHQVRRDR